ICIALPLIAMQAINVWVLSSVSKAEQAERLAKQAELDRVANPLTRECLRMKQDRPSLFDVDEQKYRDYLNRYIDACRQAVGSDPSDTRGKIALSSALFDAHRRAEAIVPLREAAAAGDTDALLQIYDWHKAWERGDVDHVQVVKRDEAVAAL